MTGLRSQQERWIKGGAQNARLHLTTILRSRIPRGIRGHAVQHLVAGSTYIVILAMLILSVPLAATKNTAITFDYQDLGLPFVFALQPRLDLLCGPCAAPESKLPAVCRPPGRVHDLYDGPVGSQRNRRRSRLVRTFRRGISSDSQGRIDAVEPFRVCRTSHQPPGAVRTRNDHLADIGAHRSGRAPRTSSCTPPTSRPRRDRVGCGALALAPAACSSRRRRTSGRRTAQSLRNPHRPRSSPHDQHTCRRHAGPKALRQSF